MEPEFQPYVGPRSFEPKDQAIFFGRDIEAIDLLFTVIAHKIVIVYAQSGAGKTSLLNAGLIPLLEKEGFEVLPVARLKGMITEKINTEKVSNIYVFNTLMNWAEGKYEVEQLATMPLADFLKERGRNTDEDGPLPRAVIFDQFEELFSLYQDRWKDRAGFFEQVSAALEEDPLLRIVFAIREDYIAQLDPYAPFLPEKLRTRFHMERLRKEAALQAVIKPLTTGPIRDMGRSFAEGVAEKLVEDLLKIRVETPQGQTVEVAGEFIEAVQLQVVCQSLWRELPLNERQITLRHLKTYGNVEQVLSRFYDDDVRTASDNARVDEGHLREWCEKVLITSMGTRGMVYREPQLTGGIPNSAIDILEDKRLIRKEMRAGARWYELTHDSFIKPIKRSNERWRQQRAEKRWEKAKIVGVALIVLIAILGVISLQNLEGSGESIILKGSGESIILKGSGESIILKGHIGRVTAALFSPSGDRVVTGSDDKTARIWKANGSGEPIVLKGHTGGVTAVSFSPDGKHIATASNDKTARIWDAENGKESIRMEHNDWVNAVTFSPDGKHIATASNDKTARIWDTENDKQLLRMEHEDGGVNTVIFSPDGKYLATVSNRTARIWDAHTGKLFAKKEHDGHIYAASFSPDGDRVVTASGDYTARIWKADGSGQPIILNNTAAVIAASFSPSDRVVTVSADDTVRIWNADGSGQPIILRGQSGQVYAASFSPSDDRVVTASEDYTARIWPIDQKKFTSSIGMEFVQIPADEFDMGSPATDLGRYDNEGPVHHVKLAKAFYLGKYEVTQKQWRDVMGTDPSNFKGDDLPVENITWDDVQQFITKLNAKEGTTKYRLPSEAEWEYAARAGTISKYSFGDDESRLGDYAWYRDNSNKTTHPVGQKKPNSWGLYDMHGNVWERVQDKWHDDYDGAPTDGSAWESGNVTGRVGRGGGFYGNARNCRSANRYNNAPDNRNTNLSFRLLRDL